MVSILNGFLVVDKPLGLSSHAVVARARRWFGTRQVGHAGTLDPLASGVLVLAVGSYTRLTEYLLVSSKSYRASVCFGQTTETYDAEGLVDFVVSPVSLTLSDIEAALLHFCGTIQQVPPVYSAIKRAGQPVYKAARRGEIVTLAPRTVVIHRLQILDWQNPILTLQVDCGAGTYIRSLAHDLGQVCGCGAYLSGLVRVASGSFSLQDAHTIDSCDLAAQAGQIESFLCNAKSVFPNWHSFVLSDSQIVDIQHGRSIILDHVCQAGYCLLWADEQLLALGEIDADGLTVLPRKVLAHVVV